MPGRPARHPLCRTSTLPRRSRHPGHKRAGPSCQSRSRPHAGEGSSVSHATGCGVQSVKLTIVPNKNHLPVTDRAPRSDDAVGREFPDRITSGQIQRVEIPIIASEKHRPIIHDRCRPDLTAGLKLPELISGVGIQRCVFRSAVLRSRRAGRHQKDPQGDHADNSGRLSQLLLLLFSQKAGRGSRASGRGGPRRERVRPRWIARTRPRDAGGRSRCRSAA